MRTGRPRVFDQDDLSLDALLASACLPRFYRAVEIDGDPYWDGGYVGNPAIWPLIYGCQTEDVVLVQLNPLTREGVPRTALDIDNRMNEIAFNSSLMYEMRAIAFVQRLLEEGGMTGSFAAHYKNMRVHMIGDEEGMEALGVTSKFNAERGFLEHLKTDGAPARGAGWRRPSTTSASARVWTSGGPFYDQPGSKGHLEGQDCHHHRLDERHRARHRRDAGRCQRHRDAERLRRRRSDRGDPPKSRRAARCQGGVFGGRPVEAGRGAADGRADSRGARRRGHPGQQRRHPARRAHR